MHGHCPPRPASSRTCTATGGGPGSCSNVRICCAINHIDRAARAAWPLFWPDATGKLRARATNPRMCSCCFVMQCMVCPWLYRCDRWMPPPDGNRLPAGRDPLNSQRFSSTTSQNEFKNAMPFLTFFCKQSRHICVTHAHAWELNYNNLILS